MINEYYAALLNDQAKNTAVGADHVPAGWIPQPLPPAVSDVRRALLQNPQKPESCNWRALELQRLVYKNDLSSLTSELDQRTGYEQSLLIGSMASYFTPRVTGSLKIKLIGGHKGNGYSLDRWTFKATAGTLTVTNNNHVSTFTLQPSGITAKLPGARASFSLSSDADGESILVWASRSDETLAQTAESFRGSLSSQLRSLAEHDSIYDGDQRAILLKAACSGEVSASVVAASLLVVGYTLKAFRRHDTTTHSVRSSS